MQRIAGGGHGGAKCGSAVYVERFQVEKELVAQTRESSGGEIDVVGVAQLGTDLLALCGVKVAGEAGVDDEVVAVAVAGFDQPGQRGRTQRRAIAGRGAALVPSLTGVKRAVRQGDHGAGAGLLYAKSGATAGAGIGFGNEVYAGRNRVGRHPDRGPLGLRLSDLRGEAMHLAQ
ncbi:MAG: hypothetical protein KAR22_08735 [Gammaproteobacteria bacterium]|nr:hypothetical protein [Gammaproteobacteria bacterium]